MTAGVAAAEVTCSGTANFGYNDTDHAFGASGGAAFSDMDLNVAFSKELDNGYTAAASVELDYADANQGNDISASDALISLTNADSGIHYGDTKHAAQNAWFAVGSMDNDAFCAADGEMVTRADMMLGDAKVSISLGDDTNLATPLVLLLPFQVTKKITCHSASQAPQANYPMRWPIKTQTPLCCTVTTTQLPRSKQQSVFV